MIDLSISTQFLWALGFAVFWYTFLQRLTPRFSQWVATKPWARHAIQNQKRMLYNFGFPQSPDPPLFPHGTSDELSLYMYSWLTVVVTIHGVCGLLVLPVLFKGWQDSSDVERLAYVLGLIADVGYDIQDLANITLSTFAPDRVGKPRTPLVFFIIMTLHHQMAMLLVIPMNMRYIDWQPYHQVCATM